MFKKSQISIIISVCMLMALVSPLRTIYAAGTPVTITSASTSSNLDSGHNGSKLYDGVISETSFWCSSSHTNGTATEWCAVFFNSCKVNRVTLCPRVWGHDCFPAKFRLQYTNDGGSVWIDIPGIYYENFWLPNTGDVDINFEEISANGIRIFAEELRSDEYRSNYYFQLAEIKVYSPQYVDRTKFSTWVSSVNSNTSIDKSKLNDGYTGNGNFYSSDLLTQNTAAYIDVYFPMQNVKGIDLFARIDGAGFSCFPEDFELQYTMDSGTQWRTIPGMSFTSYPKPVAQLQSFRFSGVVCNGIRIHASRQTKDSFNNYFLQMAEIQIPQLEDNLLSEIIAKSAFVTPSNDYLDSAHDTTKLIDNDFGEGNFYCSTIKSGADISSNPVSIGIKFTTYKTISRLELYSRLNVGAPYCFPGRFEIDYSTDGGTTWYEIPKHNYLSTDYALNGRACVKLQFGEVTANALRVKVTKVTQDNANNYALQMREIKAFGTNHFTPFAISSGSAGDGYPTSTDTQKFMDINNFYSIFGMGAQSEGAYLELGGRKRWNEVATANELPYTMYKLYWNNNYDLYEWKYDLFEVPLDYISPTDQYVWSVETGRKHLDDKMNFNNNAAFINSVWEYIKWTGDTAILDEKPCDRAFYYKDGTQTTKFYPTKGRMQYVGIGAYVGQTFRPTFSFNEIGVYVFINKHTYPVNHQVKISLYKVANGADDTLIASTTKTLNWPSTSDWSWQNLTFGTQTYLNSDYHIVVENVTPGVSFWDSPLGVLISSGDEYTSGYGTISGNINGNVDVDKMNLTLWEKCQKAMNWQLNTLTGKQGGTGKIMTIKRDVNNPLTDAYQYYAGNAMSSIGVDGINNRPANYWDLIRFGYKDAYQNIDYYLSLQSMAKLYETRGDTINRDAFNATAAQVKTDYNNTFWNPTTGRYVTWIDSNGNVRDYGFTSINLEAVVNGLTDSTKDSSIMNWITGARTVAGDTVTGTDIYYGSMAPRTNTKNIKDSNNLWEVLDGYWDWQADGSGRGDYGKQEENGGTILFISYYDILGRLKVRGVNDAWGRFNSILNDFHNDVYYRHRDADPRPLYGRMEYKQFTLDLPEVGNIPAVMVNGFVGIKGIDSATGLNIYPNIPTGYSYMQAEDIRYKDRVIKVISEGSQNGVTIEIKGKTGTSTTSMSGKIGNLSANTAYVIKNISSDGINIAPVITTTNVTTNANGELAFSQSIGTGDRIIKISRQ